MAAWTFGSQHKRLKLNGTQAQTLPELRDSQRYHSTTSFFAIKRAGRLVLFSLKAIWKRLRRRYGQSRTSRSKRRMVNGPVSWSVRVATTQCRLSSISSFARRISENLLHPIFFSIIGHFLVIPINLLAFLYTILVSLSFKYAYPSLHHLLLFTHLLDLGLDSDFSSYLLMAVDFCLQTSLFGYLFLPDTPHHLQ